MYKPQYSEKYRQKSFLPWFGNEGCCLLGGSTRVLFHSCPNTNCRIRVSVRSDESGTVKLVRREAPKAKFGCFLRPSQLNFMKGKPFSKLVTKHRKKRNPRAAGHLPLGYVPDFSMWFVTYIQAHQQALQISLFYATFDWSQAAVLPLPAAKTDLSPVYPYLVVIYLGSQQKFVACWG